MFAKLVKNSGYCSAKSLCMIYTFRVIFTPSLLPFIEKSSLLTKVEKIWIQYTCFKHNASRKRFGSAMYEHSREIVFESYRLMRVWIGNFTYGITNLVGKPPFFCRIKNHVYSWCLLLLIVRQLMHKKANLCIYI